MQSELPPIQFTPQDKCQFILTRGDRKGQTCNNRATLYGDTYYCKNHGRKMDATPTPQPPPPSAPVPQKEVNPSEEEITIEYDEDPLLYQEEEAYDMPPEMIETDPVFAGPPSEDAAPGEQIGAFLDSVPVQPKVEETVKIIKKKTQARKVVAEAKKVAIATGDQLLHEDAQKLEQYVEDTDQSLPLDSGSYDDDEVEEIDPEEVKRLQRIQQNEQLFVEFAQGAVVLAEGILNHNLEKRGLRATGAAEQWNQNVAVQEDLRTVIREDEHIKQVIEQMTPMNRLMFRTVSIFGLTTYKNYKIDSAQAVLGAPLPPSQFEMLRRQLPDLPDK